MTETIQWIDDSVVMIDQTRLPLDEKYVTCRTYEEMATAIRDMIIRGAPAIGVAAAMGVALGVLRASEQNLDAEMETICATLAATRRCGTGQSRRSAAAWLTRPSSSSRRTSRSTARLDAMARRSSLSRRPC